ncbi:MAG: phytoene/squalene synthase family protein [Elusimicrobia bacterium]|nr:phytoene/squalene synthase family protein [Elusimicrobiota bacterium]
MNALDAYAARLADPADLGEAQAFCLRLACERRGFDLVLRFASRRLRPHIAALYAFARIARDMVEDPAHEGARRQRLEDWRRQLQELGRRPPEHPAFAALGRTLQEFSLPASLCADIVSGCLQDEAQNRYRTYDELLGLCRRAADPLGRLLFMMHGYREASVLRYSDALCSGLLMTRFWRDLSLDLKRDRVYIPEEDFQAFGYTEADLRMGVCNEKFRELMKFEINRTRALFEQARPLPEKLPRLLAWQVRLAWYGGRETLRRIRKRGFDTITHRPLLSRWDWLPLTLRTVLKP